MSNIIKILNKDGQLVVSSRQVARDFEKEHKHVLESIDALVKGVAEKSADLFIPAEYQHEQNKQIYREYLLTRDGFSLLVMGFTGPKALRWKLKYIEAFNKMEQALKEQQKFTCIEDVLIQALQEMKDVKQQLNQVNHKVLETKEELKTVREVIEIRPSNSWRGETNRLMTKICFKLKDYKKPKEEAYKALEERAGCDLKIRLKNMKARQALQGVPKSKIDELNYLDVIAQDKKLIEIYTAIVKEMAIKYKVA